MVRRIPLLPFCLAISCLSFAPHALAQTTPPAQTPHAVTLLDPQVSVLDGGRVVVSMRATGDLSGLLTLTLDSTEGGNYTGQWSLAVAFLQDLNPDGSVALAPPEIHTEPIEHAQHREYVRFVHQGSLSGTVSQATCRTDATGKIVAVTFAQLTLAGGVKNFAGATGFGTIASVFTDGAFSSNSLTLTF